MDEAASAAAGSNGASTGWRRARRWIHRIWITFGISATLIFGGWSLLAYRASPAARASLVSSGTVSVEDAEGSWRFEPAGVEPARIGLLIFPGGLVEASAYAPLARAAAEAGFSSVIMELPMRGAFGGADSPDLFAAVTHLLDDPAGPESWVVAGHSRGGVVASDVVARSVRNVAGLVLIGTTHPRDVDLAGIAIPVVKLAGTRDGLARPDAVRANAHLLPPATRWIWIDGANHSQFGWYGFQPMDRRATISREEQQALMVEAVLDLLRELERVPA